MRESVLLQLHSASCGSLTLRCPNLIPETEPKSRSFWPKPSVVVIKAQRKATANNTWHPSLTGCVFWSPFANAWRFDPIEASMQNSWPLGSGWPVTLFPKKNIENFTFAWTILKPISWLEHRKGWLGVQENSPVWLHSLFSCFHHFKLPRLQLRALHERWDHHPSDGWQHFATNEVEQGPQN